jgi:hypothetical protein
VRIYQRRSRLGGSSETAPKSTATDSNQQHSGVAAWNRRHQAARRLPPLDCGCPDPWPCRCSDPPLTHRQIDAGRMAAEHILRGGRIPLLEIEVLQALWRRGGDDRAFAEQLHQLTGGAVA